MTNKKIYLYNDGIGAVEYIQHVGDDRTIVNSARVSFGKEVEHIDEKDKKLIKYLIKHKHTSTLEHCFVTFRFTVPLFVRSQHHRHRTWSYNEISRRYTEVDLNFYEPLEFRTQHKSNRQASNVDDANDPIIESLYTDDDITHMFASEAVKEHHLESLELFNKLLEAGVCREQARGVLPQNLYTQYYGSCNLSNLLKFIDLRLHEGAQWEIQQMAQACLEIVTDLFPITVSTYRELRGQGHDE